MRILSLLLTALFFALPRPAAAQDPMALARTGNWPAAEAAARQLPDPVAGKLITWLRLQTQGAATEAEIQAFITANPDWPLLGLLARRRDEAVAGDQDDAKVVAQCEKTRPAFYVALGRCAEALAKIGRPQDAGPYARAAWVAGGSDPAWEQRFAARWSNFLTRDDQRKRFDILAWTDTAAAQRQAARLEGADRRIADARLALRRDDPGASWQVAALTPAQRAEPAIMLEQARYLRRTNREEEAVALWQSSGAAAEQAAPPDRLGAFWDERNLLARRRLRVNDTEGAYAKLDADFLSGFIALRRMADNQLATKHFQALADGSRAVITQGRARFWLARAARDPASARAADTAAASLPTSYYGQMSAVMLGDDAKALAKRIAAAQDPVPEQAHALAITGNELARAAALLTSWGEARRAIPFLLKLSDTLKSPADQALLAQYAHGLGLSDAAVALARQAGRTGLALPQSGWPVGAQVPAGSEVDPALVLGVTRQESSFDPAIVSPAGARGLMQLMPATATQLARTLNVTLAPTSLTTDPALNLRLGTRYLKELLDKFGGSLPLAIAAYNAGPGRVQEWLALNGDPRTGAIDMIDWIELIPFSETRNYVERVIENTMIYRAHLGEVQPHPLAEWLR